MPDLLQHNGKALATGQGLTIPVVFDEPTQPGSMVVVIAVGTRDAWLPFPMLLKNSGFSAAVDRVEDELAVAVWYRAGAPSMSSVEVSTLTGRAFQVRVLEIAGLAQTAVLDRVAVNGDNDDYKQGSSTPRSGATNTTSQGDEFVLGIVANRYSSGQSGFTGGMTRISDTVTPDRSSEDDYKRCRVTVHAAVTTSPGAWQIGAQLPTKRDWIAAVLTFKGGTTGPAPLVSVDQAAVLDTTGGTGTLTMFGPLRSVDEAPVLDTDGGSGYIGPFELQWRLGGREGLLIGQGTDYRVESVSGLGGHEQRVSDGDLPRGAGSSRGVDLQTARLVGFKVNYDHPDPHVLEQRTQRLLSALRPQPTTDWDLLFRLPGMPLQILRCRPIALPRDLDAIQLLLRQNGFTLRGADPRIYSSAVRVVEVPVTPAGQTTVTVASVPNLGNDRAYPTIRIANRGTVAVTSVQVVNASAGAMFEIATVVPPGAQLAGDMTALVTASRNVVVALDGQPKYGAWVPPRTPFFLSPDPDAANGVNAVWCRTTPAGADVLVTLEYRDTSYG